MRIYIYILYVYTHEYATMRLSTFLYICLHIYITMHKYMHICKYRCIYICIYIEREGGRDMYSHIYIYRERERERATSVMLRSV